MKKVFLQYWEESERGVGINLNGCTLHLNHNEWMKYVSDIYKLNTGKTPYIYNRIVGEPIKVKVNDELYNILLEQANLSIEQYQLNNLIKLKNIILNA